MGRRHAVAVERAHEAALGLQDGRIVDGARRRAGNFDRGAEFGGVAGEDQEVMAEAAGFQRVMGDQQHGAAGQQFGGEVLDAGAGDGVEG